MTFEEFLERGRIQSKMLSYQRKKEKAIEVCAEQLASHKSPYLSLSGGKDSVAMAFIVNEAANRCGKTFRIWSHISDASFPGTEEIVREVAERVNRPLDIYKPDFSAFDVVGEKQRQKFGKTGVFFASIREYAKDKDLSFVGVRAAESKRRMQAAKAHGMVFHSSIGDCDIVNPLQWFSLDDVSAALYEYKAPVHPIYSKVSVDTGTNSNGEQIFIRLGYITSKDLIDKGTAVFLRVNYPDKFNKLAEAFPEIRRFV